MRFPSCHPGFEFQAHHLHFYQFMFELFHVEKTKGGRDFPNFNIESLGKLFKKDLNLKKLILIPTKVSPISGRWSLKN